MRRLRLEWVMDVNHSVFVKLAEHLQRQRGALLKRWRASVRNDAGLTSGDSLPRAQLEDHVPAAMIAFERHLMSGGSTKEIGASAGTIDAANAHGMHRWQQGFGLREVVRELGHLNLILVRELDVFAASAEVTAEDMSAARQSWALVYAAGIEQSTSQFFQLQQREAAGHVNDLKLALIELNELDQHRAALWQQLAHDLRGNVGVVAAATRAIAFKDAPEAARERFTRMLERNVDSLRHLLDDVTSLTRLQAGEEHREVSKFDVSSLLNPVCEGLQAMAHQRGLYLHYEGPSSALVVEGDAVKVHRLAQNLILNALKYTERGGVDVRWASCDTDDFRRWSLIVQDTGPGIHAGPGSPLVEALEAATDLAHESDGEQPSTAIPSPDTRPTKQSPGEGIGLSIVKRLAELLDATVEVESDPSSGTIFTILLPKSYAL
jgi:signal transduction histidine kinase